MTVEEIRKQIQHLEELLERNSFDEALAIANKILNEPSVNTDTVNLVKLYSLLGKLYENTSKFTEAIEYNKKVLELQKLHNNKVGIVDCLSTIGNIYESISDYPTAFQYLKESLDISNEIEYNIGIARNLGNIGIIYLNLSDYQIALEYFEKALSYYEELQDYVGIAINVGNIGNLFRHLNEYSKAIEYYQKALDINSKQRKYDGAAINLGNIGIVYYYLQNYELALEYFHKAIALKEEHGFKNKIAFNLSSIGNVYFSMEDYPKSLEYYHQALQLNTENHDKRGVGFNLKNLAFVYYCLDDISQSFDFINQCWNVAKELQDQLLEMECLELYSMLHEKTKDFEQAMRFFRRFVSLKDSINSQDAKQKALLFDQKRQIEEDEKSRLLKLARFQEQERIFHNILPVSIANRLIEGETTIAESYENVSIFFSDIVGFTELSSQLSPSELVVALNTIFTAFDRIGTKYGLEKIKTIGDAYMAVCGVPEQYEDHSLRTAKFALEIAEILPKLRLKERFEKLQIRIGLHCGGVVAGIIGERKFAYDVWGDAVNVASRMESTSEQGRIQISEQFAKAIKQHQEFSVIPRGEINIKGKGSMNTFWLEKA
ncbi:MAG: tetratricopeptide repeat protein [Candidatus Kapabacteria bacterium]|nr:tetratricopeptide repeat protein [Candidatus Kapabacteria bacterium]